ncbi:hypothetical protein ACVJGD_004580 [Bradyrhizobium sp. USDA 10063]
MYVERCYCFLVTSSSMATNPRIRIADVKAWLLSAALGIPNS